MMNKKDIECPVFGAVASLDGCVVVMPKICNIIVRNEFVCFECRYFFSMIFLTGGGVDVAHRSQFVTMYDTHGERNRTRSQLNENTLTAYTGSLILYVYASYTEDTSVLHYIVIGIIRAISNKQKKLILATLLEFAYLFFSRKFETVLAYYLFHEFKILKTFFKLKFSVVSVL